MIYWALRQCNRTGTYLCYENGVAMVFATQRAAEDTLWSLDALAAMQYTIETIKGDVTPGPRSVFFKKL